jgi:integrase
MRRWQRLGYQHAVEWNGEPVGRISKAFRSACRKAGLGDEVSPHTLRHTAATWMMQNGVPTWQAAGFLGMTEEIIRDVYGHHHPEYLAEAKRGVTARRQKPDRRRSEREHGRAENLYVLGETRKVP